ncbi:hypothetical protein ACH5RR_028691 [Cinchona calisaya]|uniref:Uncharacterized protein n=1 Tax=Cinchona calisaya TaxID=153742 RepID=A0ABD2YTF7_9GENT
MPLEKNMPLLDKVFSQRDIQSNFCCVFGGGWLGHAPSKSSNIDVSSHVEDNTGHDDNDVIINCPHEYGTQFYPDCDVDIRPVTSH